MSGVTPRQIGPYQVLELLGQGSMSLVYRATLPLLGGQEFAVKLLRERCKPGEVSGFLGECAKVKRLGTHPHIVPLYFAGRDRRLSRYYVAMELVQGSSLAQVLRKTQEGSLPIEQALRIGVQVASALEHAHQRGILHLDVKPSNILLQEESVLAKLTDFGSARLREELPSVTTQSGLGTPAYRPWEQTPAGRQAGTQPSERSDVYALAATLFHLLTGLVPLPDQEEQVQPPSAWRSDLPSALDDLLLRALSREPRLRPATMYEFRRALEQLQAPRRVSTVAPLPAISTGLIGRDVLLHEIKTRLLAGENLALYALNGLPGVGKTALAAALVNDPEIQACFVEGILWGGLGPQPDLLALLNTWGSALGVNASTMASLTSIEAWSTALRQIIDQHRLLLVIDDAWNIEAALACQVGGLHSVHLLTTRSPEVALRFAGTGTIRVPELEAAAGQQLLAQLAPNAVAATPEAVEQVAQTAGGLPLALVLMGKFLQAEATHPQPRRLRAALEFVQKAVERVRLAQPLAPADRPPSLPPGAPLSLAASIDVSYRALSRPSRSLLLALSVFPAKPNTFSEEAALAVAGCTLRALDTLSNTGLLESSGPGRYSLHQAIADFVQIKRKQGKKHGSAQLVAYYVAYVAQHQQDYATLDLDMLNIQTAFDAAHAQHLDALLIKGVTAWWPYLLARGFFDLAEKQVTQAMEAAKAIGDAPGLVLALLQLGQTIEKRGDYGRAITYFEEALEISRQRNLPEHLGALLHALGWMAEKRGEYSLAVTFLEQGLEIARQQENREQLVPLLSSLGVVAYKQGNHTDAEKYFQEALKLARQLGLQERIASLLDSLGSLSFICGDQEAAEAYYREALTLARQIGHQDRIASLLGNLGSLLAERGAFAEGETYLQEGLALARQLGHRERMAFLLANLGETINDQGDHRRAVEYFQEGIVLARQTEYREVLGVLLTYLGGTLCQAGDYLEAERCLLEGQAIAQEIGYALLRAENLLLWGELHLQRGHLDLADTVFHAAKHLAEEASLQTELAESWYGLARLAAALGDVTSARQLGQESVTCFEHLKDYRAGVVQKWLDQLPALKSAPSLEEAP